MSNKFNRFTTSTKNSDNNRTFVILAAGAGRRMRSYGTKSLLPYEGKQILRHQIDTIKMYDRHADIVVVVGFEAEKVIPEFPDVRVVENPNYEETSPAESLRLALNVAQKSNLFVIHGDVIFSKGMIDVDTGHNYLLIDKLERIHNSKLGVILNGNEVCNVSHGLDTKWGQIMYLRYNHFADLLQILHEDKYSNNGKMQGMGDVINALLMRDIRFFSHEQNHPNSTLVEINIVKDLA